MLYLQQDFGHDRPDRKNGPRSYFYPSWETTIISYNVKLCVRFTVFRHVTIVYRCFSKFQADFLSNIMMETSGYGQPTPYWLGLHQERGGMYITLTSQWPRWRLKSPAARFFAQPFIQAQIKVNIKAPRHWPLWGEFTGDLWIPRTKVQ